MSNQNIANHNQYSKEPKHSTSTTKTQPTTHTNPSKPTVSTTEKNYKEATNKVFALQNAYYSRNPTTIPKPTPSKKIASSSSRSQEEEPEQWMRDFAEYAPHYRNWNKARRAYDAEHARGTDTTRNRGMWEACCALFKRDGGEK